MNLLEMLNAIAEAIKDLLIRRIDEIAHSAVTTLPVDPVDTFTTVCSAARAPDPFSSPAEYLKVGPPRPACRQ
jgi:hypothetical protein